MVQLNRKSLAMSLSKLVQQLTKAEAAASAAAATASNSQNAMTSQAVSEQASTSVISWDLLISRRVYVCTWGSQYLASVNIVLTRFILPVSLSIACLLCVMIVLAPRNVHDCTVHDCNVHDVFNVILVRVSNVRHVKHDFLYYGAAFTHFQSWFCISRHSLIKSCRFITLRYFFFVVYFVTVVECSLSITCLIEFLMH